MNKLKINYVLLLGIVAVALSSCGGPKARFTVKDSAYTAPEEIILTNQSEDAESYIWDFGDGTTSTDSIGKHRYYESGNYLVKLKAINGKKVNTKEARIKVDAPRECLVRIQTPQGQMIAFIELLKALWFRVEIQSQEMQNQELA